MIVSDYFQTKRIMWPSLEDLLCYGLFTQQTIFSILFFNAKVYLSLRKLIKQVQELSWDIVHPADKFHIFKS